MVQIQVPLPNTMASPIFDKDRAARILVDAVMLGEQTACDKWQISRKTLSRYRDRLGDDPELSRVVQQKRRLIDDGWRREANDLLKQTLTKLGTLVKIASVEHMRDVVGVVKIVGDLLITQNAVEPDEEPEDEFQPGLDRQSAPSEKAPSADPLEEEDEDSPVEEA